MAYDTSQTILFTSKMANYDMGLVSTVPSGGSFISFRRFCSINLGKFATRDLGKGVFDGFSFLFFSPSIGYDTKILDVGDYTIS